MKCYQFAFRKRRALVAAAAVAVIGIVAGCSLGLRGTIQDPVELSRENSRFVTIDDLRIHYTDSNHSTSGKTQSAAQPVLLLLHGYGGSVRDFDLVHDQLAARYRIVAFDRPPFGLSQKALKGDFGRYNPYTPERQSEFALELMDELHIDSAILLGHSAGGRAALLAASNHPERVEGLILVSPAVDGGGMGAFWRGVLSLPPMRWFGPSIVRLVYARADRLQKDSFHDPAAITDEMRQEYWRGTKLHNWDRALWRFTLTARNMDWDEVAQNIIAPTLIITGDADVIVDPAVSKRLHAELPMSTLHVFERTGHIAFQEQPEQFLAVVHEWLRETQ